MINEWCGTDICLENLSDGRCNLCLYYSYESYYDSYYEKYLPMFTRYYLPDANGHCVEPKNDKNYDIPIIVIISVISFVLILMIIGICVLIVLLICAKNNKVKEGFIPFGESTSSQI